MTIINGLTAAAGVSELFCMQNTCCDLLRIESWKSCFEPIRDMIPLSKFPLLGCTENSLDQAALRTKVPVAEMLSSCSNNSLQKEGASTIGNYLTLLTSLTFLHMG
jgi:hypothetical protein